MKRNKLSIISLILCISILVPALAFASVDMDGQYCTKCGSAMEPFREGGILSARTNTCPICKVTCERQLFCIEYGYYCSTCRRSVIYKTERFYECCGERFY